MEFEVSDVTVTAKRRMSIESLFAISVFLPVFFSYLTEILIAFDLPSLTSISYALLYLLYAILFFNSLLRQPAATLGIAVLSLFAILISCLINGNVVRYIFNFGNDGITTFLQSNLMMFLSRCVLSIIVFAARMDIRKLTEYLKEYSLYLVLIYIAMNIVNFSAYGQNTSYMNNAYMALLPISLLYCDSCQNKAKGKWVFAVFGALLLVVSGSRGAALCMLCFIGMYHILAEKMTVKKLAVMIIVFSICLALIWNLESVLAALAALFEKIGISTRLIDLINGKENAIYQLSGRDEIYTNAVRELGFFGGGLFGDRVGGGYVHNLVLEIILDFGYFLGIPILLYLLFKMIQSIFVLRRDPRVDVWAALIIALLCVKYMVSDSYLISQDFWLLMGIIFCANSKYYQEQLKIEKTQVEICKPS